MATQTSTLPQGTIFASKPAATPATAAPAPTSERIRPYKDFLTPSLHRRFSHAAGLVFAGCYLAALLISFPGLLWSLNPISFHGARAFILLISCLMVFISRVANVRFGSRMACSGAETVYQTLTSGKTLTTAAWYVLSAFIFGEVYLWSRDESANLGWIDPGRPYEWARVNENPLFLRAVWFCIAIGQTGLHLARDLDTVKVPQDRGKQASPAQDPTPSRIPQSLQQLWAGSGIMVQNAIALAFPGFVATIVLYFALLRRFTWPFFYRMAQILYSDVATEPTASGVQTTQVGQLVGQSVWSAFMLAMLWELSNACFTIYISEPPIKRDEPLTSEVKDNAGVIVVKSRDPNGSLLNGLSSKKDMTKGFALWELSLICARFPTRRKTLYLEVDRKDGSTWTQISKICLDELTAISTRIKTALDPDKAQKEHDEKQLQQQQQVGLIAADPQEPLGLPKIANRGVNQNADIYQQRKSDFVQHVGNVAKSFGQSPGAQNPLVPRARRAIEWGADHTLSQSDRERLSRQGLQQSANSTFDKLLASPPGEPFRQTFARRACAVVFGVPTSHRINILHASRTLADLCRHAIKEDDYGQVAKSVRTILTAFTKVIRDVDLLLATLKPTGSDVSFVERDRRVGEVEEVKEVLREGLEAVLLAYGEYADSVGLTKTEVREAREAVGKGREMRQV